MKLDAASPKPTVLTAQSVSATLEGLKTATRRVVVPQPVLVGGAQWEWAYETGKVDADDADVIAWSKTIARPSAPLRFCPYGGPGSLLWVKEPYAAHGDIVLYRGTDSPEYGGKAPSFTKWKNPRFMPKRLSRLTLRITVVGFERLQTITDTGCYEEGVLKLDDTSPRDRFTGMWDRLNGARGYPWHSNPWVWVLHYEVAECKKSPGTETSP